MRRGKGFGKSLRGRIVIGLIIITAVVQVFIDISIWNNLQKSVERVVVDDISKIKDLIEYDINKIAFFDKDAISRVDLTRIFNRIKEKYDVYVSLEGNEDIGEISYGDILNIKMKEEAIKENKDKMFLVQCKIQGDIIQGCGIYPIYIHAGYHFWGNIIIQKEYTKEIRSNKRTMRNIIGSQILLYGIMIIFMNIWVKNKLKKLSLLSQSIKGFGEGKEKFRMDITDKGEVGVLISEFNKMSKKIENQIQIMKREKERIELLEKENKEFFDCATHEMKTPLTAIEGYSELLKEGILEGEDMERAFQRLNIEAGRLKSLVLNMLQVARDRKVKEGDPKSINPGEFIQKIVDEYKSLNCNFKIKLVVYNNLKEIRVNEEQFEKIIRNLVDNAIKYSSDKSVEIEVLREEGEIIRIHNKCGKIPFEIRQDILKPFVKYNFGDNKMASSGLGLMIVKELCEKNRLELQYDNHVEDTFTIKICRTDLPAEGY